MELTEKIYFGNESPCTNGIRFEELKVWAPEEKSWWRRKSVKPKTLILRTVSGCIKRGEFVAVIGPSGAGKTTFFTLLAGKCTLPSEGNVSIDGRNVKELKGVVEIVPQNEVFMDKLTVMEHLVFMAEMKLGSVRKTANKLKLNELIRELKLKPHASTQISSLSGGEQRLLSLASSLISSPEILICDEPTTGLDSYNASLVVGVLKRLSVETIVLCSVHQPSSDLFKEFNSILLMADGKLMFHGTHEECEQMFDRIGVRCPKNYNPAEFYIRAVSPNLKTYTNKIDKILDNPHVCIAHETGLDPVPRIEKKICRRNWFKQVHLLLWRSSLTVKRDIRRHVVELFICMMLSSLIIATCYTGISGTTQRGVQDFRGFLWLMSSEVCYSVSYNALYGFEATLSLFRREVGIYSGSAYFVARFLSFIPRSIIWPVFCVISATLTVDLPNHILTTMEFIVVLILAAVSATAYGLGMGALFVSSGAIGDVMPCTDLPLFLVSGVFYRISAMPLWLYPIRYISHFYYTMDAVSNIYWRQIDFIDCPINSTTDCLKDGAAVLLEDGYSKNFILEDGLGFIFVTLMWCLLGYLGLKKEENKGYTY